MKFYFGGFFFFEKQPDAREEGKLKDKNAALTFATQQLCTLLHMQYSTTWNQPNHAIVF